MKGGARMRSGALMTRRTGLVLLFLLLAAAVGLILFMGWMAQMLIHFTAQLFSQISTVGG